MESSTAVFRLTHNHWLCPYTCGGSCSSNDISNAIMWCWCPYRSMGASVVFFQCAGRLENTDIQKFSFATEQCKRWPAGNLPSGTGEDILWFLNIHKVLFCWKALEGSFYRNRFKKNPHLYSFCLWNQRTDGGSMLNTCRFTGRRSRFPVH